MTTRTYRSAMQVNVPTPRNGLVFPQQMLEAAIETYLEPETVLMGMIEGPEDDENFDLDVDRVSHLVDNIYIDREGYLCVTVTFLDTKWGTTGKAMADLLTASPVFFVIPDWDDETVLTSVEIRHINLRPVDAMFEEGVVSAQ